jgi:hypothetical protein
MSVDKFKFVSPGVFLDEIDESGIPNLPERMGPLIIGRFPKGPGLRPIKVESYKEFANLFGEPEPGNASGDIWRSGGSTAPTYAAYAVKAWLRNNSPCTVYRVLGENASNADTTDATAGAGWKTDLDLNVALASGGGAYGLLLFPSASSTTSVTGTLAAVWYLNEGAIVLTGSSRRFQEKATTTLTVADAGQITTNNQISLVTAGGDTVTITGHASANAMTTTSGASTDGTFAAGNTLSGGSTNNATQAAAIAATINLHDEFTATSSNAVVTVTQNTGGASGNTTITLAKNGGDGDIAADDLVVANTSKFAGGSDLIPEGTNKQGAGIPIKSATGQKFTAKILNASGVVTDTATFDFNRDSETFIRKVFNTDPTQTNSSIVTTAEKYWLGETFESNLRNGENSKLKSAGTAVADTADLFGVIVGLKDGGDGSINWRDHMQQARAAQTGFFISQDNRGGATASFDPASHTTDLFKFHALDSGEQANRDYKVSITDIKVPSDNYNKFGTFTVQVRSAYDRDSDPTILEQYSNCSLDPTSPNYISRLIGDLHYTYDSTNKRITEHGDNPNRSKILRVEVSEKVKAGAAEGLSPYGVKGPSVPKTEMISDDTTSLNWAVGSGSIPIEAMVSGHPSGELLATSKLSASIEWPTSRLRASSSEGQVNQPSKAYFGYQANVSDSRRFDQTNIDLHRGQPAGHDPTGLTATYQQYSWVFTLDDVKQSTTDTVHHVWASGSRAAGTSWTAKSGSSYILTGSDTGLKKFTSPMFGGFDGFDVTEKDPLRNSYMSTSTEVANSTYFSLKKAIDIAADKDFIEFDLAAMPGITNDSLNSRLLTACEERADAMAVLDIRGGYKPPHENNSLETANLGSVEETVTALKDLNLNSSYGCAFYPFVKIRDDVANSILYVPPSVVALGTMSSAQRKSAVWFAPAGFTRGGLSEGSAGLPVLGVRERLTSAQRDRLYDANINPIASFPSEGIVVFGQKTLQVTKSALDRINVRRLLIYVKKEVSRIASRLLFDQNVQQTWDRFTGQVIPFLEGVQAGLGLTDFRVVLDDSTTTPDLVDRNIMYAKIFLKPARAIEFIALDFIITRSGASFDD